MSKLDLRRLGRGVALALLVASAPACDRAGEGAPAANAGGGRGGRGGPGGRVVAVETGLVEIGSIARRVTVSGVVEPIRSIGVNSQISGALLDVMVEEGSVVDSGAVLAVLDDRELRAQLASAEASYELAQAAYTRAVQLRERQVITEAEFERDRAAYAAAEAQLDQLRTRVEYATVRAPVAGIITEKRVEAGDVVGTQTRLFTIADVSTMVVRVHVSELDVVELAAGDPVAVVLDAFPGRELNGRIRRIFPAADPTSRLVPVEVALSGEAARLARPGFLARATFELSARENVLIVPAAAVVGGGSSAAVYVVEDGIATRRTVSPGMSSEGLVEILSGVRAGERVVVTGASALRDGAAVRDMTLEVGGRPVPAAAEAATTITEGSIAPPAAGQEQGRADPEPRGEG